MIVPIVLVGIVLLLLFGCLWTTGGRTVYTTQGSGIIEAIPEALDDNPAPPEGQLVLISYPLGYGFDTTHPDGLPLSATAVCDVLDGVIETIAASGADIALLQEVDLASQRTCEIDQLYYIAAALGWGYAARAVTWECRYLPWPWRRPTGRVRAGMGVISRYPLTQHVRHHLPHAQSSLWLASRFFPRHTVQMVDVQCGATTLRVLHAYVETRRSGVRQRQMRQLAAFVHGARTPSCILMGTLRGVAQDDTVSGLIAEPPNPLHAVTASTDYLAFDVSSTQSDAVLIGRSLQAQEVRIVPVSTSISNDLPLVLHLRWELPVMTVLG